MYVSSFYYTLFWLCLCSPRICTLFYRFNSNRINLMNFYYCNILRLKCVSQSRKAPTAFHQSSELTATGIDLMFRRSIWVSPNVCACVHFIWIFLSFFYIETYTQYTNNKKTTHTIKIQIKYILNMLKNKTNKQKTVKQEKKMKLRVTIKHSFMWFVWFVWIYLKKLSIKYLTILTLNHCTKRNNEQTKWSARERKQKTHHHDENKPKTKRKRKGFWIVRLLSFASRYICRISQFCSRGVLVHKNLSEACQLKHSVVFHIHDKLNLTKTNESEREREKQVMFWIVYDIETI